MVVGGRELIDTLWNVNLNENTKQMTELIELIDTLWNVNTYEEIKEAGIQLELIDTLWNVNSSCLAFYQNPLRINRYIMECK